MEKQKGGYGVDANHILKHFRTIPKAYWRRVGFLVNMYIEFYFAEGYSKEVKSKSLEYADLILRRIFEDVRRKHWRQALYLVNEYIDSTLLEEAKGKKKKRRI